MDIETIRDYCIRKKGTTEEFPFDNVTLVFKVMGKMYACIGLDNPEWLSLKCAPEYALELREHHSGIEEPITSIRNIGTKYPYKVTLTTNLFYH